MPTSQFLPFGIGGGSGSPNTLSPTAYAALTALLANGFQPGIARSEEVNTALRQVTTGVAALASFAATHGDDDVLDNGVIADFAAALKSALDNLYIQDLSGLVPTSAFTGSNQDLTGESGFQRLPGGLILQWGSIGFPNVTAGIPGYTGSVVYADNGGLVFPNAALRVFTGLEVAPGGGNNIQAAVVAKDRFGFTFQLQEWSSEVNPGTLTYFAIGR